MFDEDTNPQVRLAALDACQKSCRILVEETRNNVDSVIACVRRIDLWELYAIQHFNHCTKTGHVEVAGRRVVRRSVTPSVDLRRVSEWYYRPLQEKEAY